jgi:hypothetical protein
LTKYVFLTEETLLAAMMLRAEAAVFTPQDGLGFKADKVPSAFVEEACSTVAPSPALTAQSPVLSPYWGFEEGSCSPDAMWAAAAMYGGYMPDGSGGYLPEFTLPESGESGFADFTGYARPRANTEPAYIDGFTLNGIQDLQSSIAGFLKQLSPSDKELESQDAAASGPSNPPGLELPPGLEAPPGLALEEVEAPPGLEAKTTVAELHARMQGRGRAATWSAEEPKKSPLPPGTTTAMFRNIPNKYTQSGLVERLHEDGYLGQLDFIYLPIDFKNKCNVGYAFVNFRTAEACARFAGEYHLCNSRDKLPGFNSKKVCEVSAARFQGCDENVRRLQASSVMAELMANPEWLPQLFDENGKALDFPITDPSKEAHAANRASRLGKQRRKGSA